MASSRVAKRPSLREEQKQFTRARLLEAALEVFADTGYSAATIDEIASQAGASRATFYLHFKSKAEIVGALRERTRPDIEAYYSDLDAVLVAGDRKAFREWVGRALAWFDDNHALVLALDQIAAEGGQDARLLHVEFTDFMPQYLKKWPRSRHREAELRVWMLITLVERVHLVRRLDNFVADTAEDTILDVLTDLWAAGLQVEKRPAPRRRAAAAAAAKA